MNITSPALLINKDIALENIRKMKNKTDKNFIFFRPHFKTHQSAEVGEWFREQGVDKITVSSLKMASYFVEHGWKDITIAFPVNPLEAENINALAAKATINLLVESSEVVQKIASGIKNAVNIFIEIDIDYNRTGVAYNDYDLIDAIIEELGKHPQFQFSGFLTHSGNSYSLRDRQAILDINKKTNLIMADLKARYKTNYPNIIVSVGDTPCCSLADTFDGVDEIRPGNFVYFDLMQWQIGSCKVENIAAVVACPVVAKYPQRNEVVVHGGAVHFSKDYIEENGEKIYGRAVELKNDVFKFKKPIADLVKLSQEHGIVRMDSQEIENTKIGDILMFVPAHSCLAVNLLKYKVDLF